MSQGRFYESFRHVFLIRNLRVFELPLEATGGYKASLDIAGIVHSVFRRLLGWFEKSFKHMFFILI